MTFRRPNDTRQPWSSRVRGTFCGTCNGTMDVSSERTGAEPAKEICCAAVLVKARANARRSLHFGSCLSGAAEQAYFRLPTKGGIMQILTEKAQWPKIPTIRLFIRSW